MSNKSMVIYSETVYFNANNNKKNLRKVSQKYFSLEIKKIPGFPRTIADFI